MAQGVGVTQEQAASILDIASSLTDHRTRNASAVTSLDRSTVRRLIDKQQPVVSELTALKRDEMLAGWQWLWLDTLVKVQETPEISYRDRHYAAITLGIASEKTLLLSGHATQLVGHLHEVRIDLPGLAARLADVSRAVKQLPAVVVEVER